MPVSPLQSRNAYSPIEVTLSGIKIFVRLPQSLNAFDEIIFVLALIVQESIFVFFAFIKAKYGLFSLPK